MSCNIKSYPQGSCLSGGQHFLSVLRNESTESAKSK
ncbi:hypothetical protein [Caudoviricetes sp.]|nr:hypothetical protein [Caudoviricetes sp.]